MSPKIYRRSLLDDDVVHVAPTVLSAGEVPKRETPRKRGRCARVGWIVKEVTRGTDPASGENAVMLEVEVGEASSLMREVIALLDGVEEDQVFVFKKR